MSSLRLAGIAGTILRSNVTRLSRPYKLNFSVTYWCQSRCQHCVKSNEIILGDNKRIEELQVGMHAIGVSGVNKIKKRFERTYSGPLIRIKASGLLPVETTPEHPILVRTSQIPEHSSHITYKGPVWKEAKFVLPKVEKKQGDYLVLPRIQREFENTVLSLARFTNENGARVAKAKNVPLEFPLNERTAWLLGLYVAEGSTTAIEIRFSLNSKERELQRKIGVIAQEIGYKIRNAQMPTETLCIISSRILTRAFDEWCGKLAPNKRIPDFIILNKNDDLIRAFLTGLDDGDGWTQNYTGLRQTKGWHHITTVSKTLAMQVQLCYASLGIIANIQEIPKEKRSHIIEGRSVNVHDVYVVSYGSKQNKYMKTRIVNGNQLRPVRKVEFISYEGKVHNIETTDNTYLVSNAITHNCSIWQIRPKGELTLQEIQEFARQNRYFKWIELTGGEPFMRQDIVEIAKAFTEECKGLYLLTMPTNSLCNYDMEIKKIEEIAKLGIPNIVITVSLDGYKELEDRIRGIPGNYDKAIRMFNGVRELGKRYKNLMCVFGFTIINLNAGQLEKTISEVMKEVPGVGYSDFHINIGQVSDNYYSNANNPIIAPAGLAMKDVEFLLTNMKKVKERGFAHSAKTYLEIKYMEGIVEFLRTKKSAVANRDGELSIFLDSYGNVFPSIMTSRKLGNIRQDGNDLDKMLSKADLGNQKEQHFTACESYQSILGALWKF